MYLQLSRQRFRIQRSGQLLILITLLMLLVAWNTGTNLFYIVGAGLLSVLFISVTAATWNLRGLRVCQEAPHAVHRGERFGIALRIENTRSIGAAISIRLDGVARSGLIVGYMLRIPAGKAGVLQKTEQFNRRGVAQMPDMKLSTGFPFGLVEMQRRVSGGPEVLVYPRVFAVRTSILEHLRGAGPSPRTTSGDGNEFFSLREYLPGDDIRYIAWRASARHGELLVREQERTMSRFVIFVFDIRRDDLEAFDDRFEDAVELVASLAITLLNRQYSVAIVSNTDYVPEGEGKAQTLKVLDMLARIQPIEQEAGDEFGALAKVGDPERASYLCVSPDPRRWGARNEVTGTRILHPREVLHA